MFFCLLLLCLFFRFVVFEWFVVCNFVGELLSGVEGAEKQRRSNAVQMSQTKEIIRYDGCINDTVWYTMNELALTLSLSFRR